MAHSSHIAILSSPGLTSLSTCCEEIRHAVDAAWSAKYRLDATVCPNLPKLHCDPLSLQNAILNLILNARDAMPEGGVISLRAAPSRPGVVPECVELSVSDTGAGCPPPRLPADFVRNAGPVDIGRRGLGLPMLERLMCEADVRVAVERNGATGATYILKFPIQPE